MAFEQATIRIEKEKEYEELKSAVSLAFDPQNVEKLLKRIGREGLRVRDWDAIVARRVLEQVTKQPTNAHALHDALTVSDQAQIREFYLSRLEEVEQKLRTKYQKIYRYY